MGKISGIGTDIVEIRRIRQALDRHGDSFSNRLFTDEEIAYCRAAGDDATSWASSFAAKEAFLKASKLAGKLEPRAAGVKRADDGSPSLEILDEETREAFKDSDIHLTLSHEKEYAVAFVVIEKKEKE